jgi:hypothetical protein
MRSGYIHLCERHRKWRDYAKVLCGRSRKHISIGLDQNAWVPASNQRYGVKVVARNILYFDWGACRRRK